ncbi:serine hydrolase [Asticcacaulis sp.]|uniref:serine hydrolase domain-containing protein n=1 Tax=Asticcacaulis sp. TaxID=1872648 RepID=UPI0031D601E8
MLTRRHFQTLAAAACGVTASGLASAADTPFDGIWTGLLSAGAVRLTLRLEIRGQTVTLISVDQGNARIPATSVDIEDEHIKLSFKSIKASFSGALTSERHIDGTFTQGAPLPLRFTKGEKAEALPPPLVAPLTREVLTDKRLAAYTPGMVAAWASGFASDVLADGARSSGDEISVQPQDQWHWGSITKSMTATLCGRLIDKGVLSWSTTVGDVLGKPDGRVPEPFRQASLLHLLSHRAGLQANLDLLNSVFFTRDALTDPREERLKWALTALKQKPVGPLGAQHLYSNNGYIIAGAMLEVLTNQPWEALIEAEVFTPLGLRSAGFGAPGHFRQSDQPLGHLVQGHNRKPVEAGPGVSNDNPVALGPAGRVHMSAPDMLLYLQAHLNQPSGFLKAETWDALHKAHFGDSYALGWVIRDDGTLWHNGSNMMWYGEVLIDQRNKTVACVCANDAAQDTQLAVSGLLASANAAAVSSKGDG